MVPPHGTKKRESGESQRTTEGETVRAHTNRTVHNSSHAEDDATREKNADASSPSPAPSSSRSTTGITRLLPGILNAGDWLNQVTALLHVRETVLQSPDPYGLPPRKPHTHHASAHALAPVVVVPEPIDVPNPPAAAESWHTARRLPRHSVVTTSRSRDHELPADECDKVEGTIAQATSVHHLIRMSPESLPVTRTPGGQCPRPDRPATGLLGAGRVDGLQLKRPRNQTTGPHAS